MNHDNAPSVTVSAQLSARYVRDGVVTYRTKAGRTWRTRAVRRPQTGMLRTADGGAA